MERKKVIAGTVIAIALLLPLGKWVIASRQESSDKQSSYLNGPVNSSTDGRMAGGVSGGAGRQGRGRGQRAARMMAEMTKELNLTAEQVKQVQSVQQNSQPKMGAIRQNSQMSRDQKRSAMAQIRQDQQAEINKFLTPDQQTKYTALIVKMQAERAASSQNGRGAANKC